MHAPFTALILAAAAPRPGQHVLDVRPEAEYAAGHIPGAVNAPHDQLAARLAELPLGADIVAYCRDRYCVRLAELPVTVGASA